MQYFDLQLVRHAMRLRIFEWRLCLECFQTWRWYSVPNSKGRLSYTAANDSRGQGYDGGSMYYALAAQNVKTIVTMQEENIPADPAIDLSRSNSLYQDGLNEVRVNGLFGLFLIRSY